MRWQPRFSHRIPTATAVGIYLEKLWTKRDAALPSRLGRQDGEGGDAAAVPSCGSILVGRLWRGSGHATPEYATLVYKLFWAEGSWETAGAGRELCPPSSYLKKWDMTFPWENFQYQGWKNILITRVWELAPKYLSRESGSAGPPK